MSVHGLDRVIASDNSHDGCRALPPASFHFRSGSYRNWYADHPYYCTILRTFHLYRNFVQLFTWYGQCGDSYVDDLRWCLCTAYFVDFPFCKNPFERYHHFNELSHLLGFHSSAVYHLFHVLSKEIFPPLYGRNRNSSRNKRIKKRQTNLGASS